VCDSARERAVLCVSVSEFAGVENTTA